MLRKWPSSPSSTREDNRCPQHRLPIVEPVNLGAVPTPRHKIEIDIPVSRSQREKLRSALREAIEGQDEGRWIVQVRPVLIYSKPQVGTWWWALTLISASGAAHSLLLGTDRQTPAGLVETVRLALGGKLMAVVCAGCGKVRVEGDLWVQRGRPKARARTSHGICPDCIQTLYPDVARRRAAKR